MARFCKRILVVRDGVIVRDEPVKDRLHATDELRIVKQEEEAARLIAAS
jgi:putative ABC transport system ATP-binding protein